MGTITGQTIGFLALLAIISWLELSASTGGGRIWWGVLGVSGPGWCWRPGSSPSSRPPRWRRTSRRTLIGKLKVGGAAESASDAIKAGFSSGTLSARIAIGGIIGTVGGVRGVLGAIYGFRKRPEPN